MSSPMNYLLNKFIIKIRTVAPYNYQSLQAKHGIKSLSTFANQASNQLRSDVAKIVTFGYICIQHIQHPKFRELQSI